jgi:hypothetical protein
MERCWNDDWQWKTEVRGHPPQKKKMNKLAWD